MPAAARRLAFNELFISPALEDFDSMLFCKRSIVSVQLIWVIFKK